MKSHYAEYILFFTFLAPHVWTEYSYICGKKSSYLQCHQNETVDINYVNRFWWYGCTTAEGTSCSNQTRLIKEKCNTRKNCSLSENDFKSRNNQPRRVFVKLYCTRKRWWSNSQYTKRVEVCGSLSAINCDRQDVITNFVFEWWYETGIICENTKYISNCMENIFKRCVGHRNCDHLNVNTDCFYFPLRATISYSCNTEGTGTSTTPVNNNRNHSYIPEDDVSPRTFVFDVTKPPNTGEIGFVLNVDRDFRLLIINKKRNKTYSLCANKWENKHARIVCRHLNISDKGNAGNISRNINLTRIAYGVDCPVNITNPFKCIPDYSHHSRDICDSIGDAAVKCYSK
ncbi:uncharacterized protein [Mytilus edulis]|uniref:uncharacterized protein n=1 Tax=Mytilus edulis TaxID=6550 RepID=UPI0039EECEB7